MALALSNNSEKDNARYSITFFYFALASFQYLITVIIFQELFFIPNNIYLILALCSGIFFGNIFVKFISENNYKLIINILAILTSIILLSDI